MLVLGIETATKTGGVALISDAGVFAEYTLNIELTHSERLMATVDRVLRDTGIAMRNVEGLAISVGPGSFTGLRIGISAIKGLALTMGLPVAAVPTLDALAWNLYGSMHPVCPLLDAKKKEVYAAIYRYEKGILEQVLVPSVLPLTALAEKIKEPTLFTGEASGLFRNEISTLLGDRALFAPRSATIPSAASIAEIGLSMLRSGRQTEPDSLIPTYIRRPEAEIAWEKRHR